MRKVLLKCKSFDFTNLRFTFEFTLLFCEYLKLNKLRYVNFVSIRSPSFIISKFEKKFRFLNPNRIIPMVNQNFVGYKSNGVWPIFLLIIGFKIEQNTYIKSHFICTRENYNSLSVISWNICIRKKIKRWLNFWFLTKCFF